MSKPRKNSARNKVQPANKKATTPAKEKFQKASWIAYAILFLIPLCLYLQTINYEYVLDDQIVLTDNQYTNKGFGGITDILSTESFAGYFGEQKDLLPGARYRPLSIVSFAIENQFVGKNSTVSHFINALLYAILCLFIFHVLYKVVKPKSVQWYWSIPFVATLLYALHPLHTEVVANVKGRDEILAMLFSMGALYASFKSLDGKKAIWLTIAAVSFFLGLLAKENTLTFFAIVPMTIYFFRKGSWKQVLQPTLVLLLVALLYLMLRYNVIGYLFSSGSASNDIMNNPFLDMSFGEKYATIMYTLGHYLRLHILPHPLTHDYYPFQIPTMHWLKPQTLVSLFVYLVLLFVSLRSFKKKSIWAYGILFFLISISIVSNVLVSVGTTMNERFVFMPSLGICISIAYFLVRYLPSLKQVWAKPLGYVLLGMFAVGFLAKSVTRIPVWKNPETLNAAAVKVSTNSARANSFMATALYNKIQRGEVPQAELAQTISDADFYADRSINIFPSYTNGNLMKAGISAEKYKQTNNLDVLLQDFKQVAIRRPDIKFLHDYFDYLKGGQDQNKMYNFFYDVGFTNLFRAGNYEWALTYLSYAYDINPNTYEINQAMYETYTALGKNNKASEFGYKAQTLKSNG